MDMDNASSSIGFCTNENAPSDSAPRTGSPATDSTTTGIAAVAGSDFRARRMAKPSPPGIIMSSVRTSGLC